MRKAINQITQLECYRNDANIRALIKKLEDLCKNAEILEVIDVYRDKVFGHLDKEAAFSDCRLDITIPMKRIRKAPLIEIANVIAELYQACFGHTIDYKWNCINKKTVIETFFNPVLDVDE